MSENQEARKTIIPVRRIVRNHDGFPIRYRWGTYRPHPLLTDLVLEKLVKYMDFQSLKAGREVCKRWEEMIRPKFLKTATLYLRFESDDLSNMESQLISLSDFTFEQSSKNQKGFQSLNIYSLRYRYLNRIAFRDWMVDYGQSVHTLTLTLGNPPDSTKPVQLDYQAHGISFEDLENFLLVWCPGLEELKFTNHLLQTNNVSCRNGHLLTPTGSSLKTLSIKDSCGVLARRILQLSPKLENLTIAGFEKDELPFFLQSTRERFARLRTLDLQFQEINENALARLATIEFTDLDTLRLGSLEFINQGWLRTYLLNAPPRRLTINTFFQNVRHKLKRLTLAEFSDCCVPEISVCLDIPLMPRLEKFIIDTESWKLENLDFLFRTKFPLLRHCRMECEGLNADTVFAKTGLLRTQNTKLVSLALTCNFSKISQIQKLVHAFPNLQSLALNLSWCDDSIIVDCLQELIKLTELKRIWIITHFLWLRKNEEAIRTFISSFLQIKSVIIEGGAYLYLKVEATIQGAQSGWNRMQSFPGLAPTISREWMSDEKYEDQDEREQECMEFKHTLDSAEFLLFKLHQD